MQSLMRSRSGQCESSSTPPSGARRNTADKTNSHEVRQGGERIDKRAFLVVAVLTSLSSGLLAQGSSGSNPSQSSPSSANNQQLPPQAYTQSKAAPVGNSLPNQFEVVSEPATARGTPQAGPEQGPEAEQEDALEYAEKFKTAYDVATAIKNGNALEAAYTLAGGSKFTWWAEDAGLHIFDFAKFSFLALGGSVADLLLVPDPDAGCADPGCPGWGLVPGADPNVCWLCAPYQEPGSGGITLNTPMPICPTCGTYREPSSKEIPLNAPLDPFRNTSGPAQSSGAGQSIAGLLQTANQHQTDLAAAEQSAQQENSNLDTQIEQAQTQAQVISDQQARGLSVTVPSGWVPCQCPADHPGAGIFVNGVQYHTPLLRCPQ